VGISPPFASLVEPLASKLWVFLLLDSPRQVVWSLLTYTDWWQPATSSLLQVGPARRKSGFPEGIPAGLLETLDLRAELWPIFQTRTRDEWLDILHVFISASVGIYLLSSAVQAWFFGLLNPVMRAVLLVGALAAQMVLLKAEPGALATRRIAGIEDPVEGGVHLVWVMGSRRRRSRERSWSVACPPKVSKRRHGTIASKTYSRNG
jgi:hypothetical protein